MTRLSRRTATTRLSPKAAKHRRRQGVADIRSGGRSPRKHSPDGAMAHIWLNGPACSLCSITDWQKESLITVRGWLVHYTGGLSGHSRSSNVVCSCLNESFYGLNITLLSNQNNSPLGSSCPHCLVCSMGARRQGQEGGSCRPPPKKKML